MSDADESSFDRVRDIPAMRKLIGCKLDDVSCSDKGEKPDEVYLLFSNGTVITVRIDGPGIFLFEEVDEPETRDGGG